MVALFISIKSSSSFFFRTDRKAEGFQKSRVLNSFGEIRDPKSGNRTLNLGKSRFKMYLLTHELAQDGLYTVQICTRKLNGCFISDDPKLSESKVRGSLSAPVCSTAKLALSGKIYECPKLEACRHAMRYTYFYTIIISAQGGTKISPLDQLFNFIPIKLYNSKQTQKPILSNFQLFSLKMKCAQSSEGSNALYISLMALQTRNSSIIRVHLY